VKRSRTARLSARVGPGLIKAACSKTDLNNDSELVNAALLWPHQMIFDRGPQPNLDACQRILSLKSDVQSIIARNDPGRWPRPLVHRPEPDLPFHPLQVPAGLSLLFYATLYIYQLQGPIANVDHQFDGFSNDPSWCIPAC
jgi:hypothetical protein